MDFTNYLKNHPDKDGRFGKYGGAYLPEKLIPAFKEINEAYLTICHSSQFINELRRIRKEFQGRPTPVYHCQRLSRAIGNCQITQTKARATIRLDWPLNTLRAQSIGRSHHVQQVPAAALVLPFACVGLDQVAPEQKARELVVKADGVVAHAYGAGQGQLGLDARGLVQQDDARAGRRLDGMAAVGHDDQIVVRVGRCAGQRGEQRDGHQAAPPRRRMKGRSGHVGTAVDG